MGQVQIARRHGTRRRADTAQSTPAPQQPTRADGAMDGACASVLARIDEVTAKA